MELIDQLRKVSFFFFVSLGIGHFIAGLLYINGYAVTTSGLVNRILFIPFSVAAFTYGVANLKYRLLEYGKNPSWLTIAAASIGIVAFIGLLLVELFVPDSSTPLGF